MKKNQQCGRCGYYDSWSTEEGWCWMHGYSHVPVTWRCAQYDEKASEQAKSGARERWMRHVAPWLYPSPDETGSPS